MDFLNFFIENPFSFFLTVGLLSLFIGSFLNVVIVRLPRMMEQNWSEECRLFLGLSKETEANTVNLCLPASHCPSCKTAIRPWHNIPILSFLWLRGHCSTCKAPIAWRYPFVEALTAIASVYVAWRYGITLTTGFALLFTWIIIALTFIDLDHHLLPDQLTLLLLWLGLVASLFNVFCTPSDAIIGAISGYLIFAVVQALFHWVTGKVGMGQGDYKFLAALGAILGWQLLPLIILLASISGIFFTLIHMAIKRHFHSQPLPFGPYLALAGWVALLWGHELMQAYLLWFN
jgi:leader peptidase (prepilin peptidase)/N-methyltransferase